MKFVVLGTGQLTGERYAMVNLSGPVLFIRAMMGVNEQRWVKFESRHEAQYQIDRLGPGGYLTLAVEEYHP